MKISIIKVGRNFKHTVFSIEKYFSCLLKVQKKGDQIENFAAFFNSKNHKKTFFNAWKGYTEKNKYLRKM